MEKGAVIKNDPQKSPKTGDWKYMSPEVDVKKCVGCETCVKFCPDACIQMRQRTEEELIETKDNFKKKDIIDFDYDFCKGCGVCAAVCPMKAIVMKK